MAVGGIGGSTPFPLYVFDPAERARDRREQAAGEQEPAVQEARRLRQDEEERRTRREDIERLDIARLLEERIVDLADKRKVRRGSIVDILV